MIAERLIAAMVRAVTGNSAQWAGTGPADHQRIYIANHSSHLDFIVIWAQLSDSERARTRPVAARDYWSRPIRRYFAERVFRAILVDRNGCRPPENGSDAVGDIARNMGGQNSVIFFPEGTRGTGEVTQSFRSGLYHLCGHLPGIEVVPVCLDNLHRILPKGMNAPVPLLSRTVFGTPITLHEGETKHDFLERCRVAVEELR